MAIWRPDPTFYPSPRMAMKAPPEKLAYVAAFDPTRQRPDAGDRGCSVLKGTGLGLQTLTHQALWAWSPLSRGAGEGLRVKSALAPLPHRGRGCRAQRGG